MVRPLPLLSLLLLVVLVGCYGQAPFATSSPSPTPVDVPTDEPTATPVPVLAPGVTADGVRNASALVAAHESLLADSAHATTVNETRRYANGTLRWRTDVHRRVAPAEARSHTVITVTGTGHGIGRLRNASRLELYRDGQAVLGIESNSTTTTYFRATADALQGGDAWTDPLAVLFSATETAVSEDGTHDGRTVYRIDAVAITDRALFAEAVSRRPADAVENTSFSARVDSRGFVHEYRVTYTISRDGTPVDVTRVVRYGAVDDTSVTEPSWYDDALANTSEE